MPTHLCCSCGRPLKISVRRDGVLFRCDEHGIVWRFVVGGSTPHSGASAPPRSLKDREDPPKKR